MSNIKFAPKDNMEDRIIHLYSDGGCRSTAKKGETIKETDKCAYAFFLKQGGHEKLDGWAGYGKTNNAMEIAGLLNGLKTIKNKNIPVVAYLDSAYVVNTIENKWYVKWERNGWTKKGGLKNADLWKELIELLREFPFFSIKKVTGHSNDEYNNLVDKHLNDLMDELPDEPSNIYKQNKTSEQRKRDDKKLEDDLDVIKRPEFDKTVRPTTTISSFVKVSHQDIINTPEEVLKMSVKNNLANGLANELSKIIEVKDFDFEGGKVFSTELNIVNEKSQQFRTIDDERYITGLLKALKGKDDMPDKYKTTIDEILRRL